MNKYFPTNPVKKKHDINGIINQYEIMLRTSFHHVTNVYRTLHEIVAVGQENLWVRSLMF